jgi:predicted HTH domain antitoxin
MAESSVTTVRLDPQTKLLLDRIAKDLHMARSSLVRRAVDRGAKSLLLDEAVSRYERGELSSGSAAESAGISIPEFVEELLMRRLPFLTDEDGIRADLDVLSVKRKGRVRRRR